VPGSSLGGITGSIMNTVMPTRLVITTAFLALR